MRRVVTAGAVALALASEAYASEGGGGGNLLIQPQFGTIFWTLVTFLILMFLLAKFAWKPLLSAVDSREKGIRDSLDTARQQRDESQRILEEHKALLNQARRERAEAVEAGRRDAERVKGEILEEARRQREQLVAQTEAQLAASLRQARVELKGEVASLAIQAAGKLLAKNLDEPTQRRLVEEYIADLERMGPAPGTH
jgi:F-type H+-transporting ATPase subunit b